MPLIFINYKTKDRIRTCYLAVSYCSFLFFICLWAYAVFLARESEGGFHWTYLAVVKDFNVTVSKRYGGSIVLFNNDFPNINLMYGDGINRKLINRHVDGYGVYYLRTIRMNILTGKEELNHWTFLVSLWWPLSVALINCVTLAIRYRRERGQVEGAVLEK